MTLSQTLYLASHILSAARIDDAFIDAALLLCHALGISKTQLYSEPERLLTLAEINHLWHLLRRRYFHEPSAYILKCWQFYGINFYVDNRVFIPRPETELLVEKAVEFAKQRFTLGNPIIADIGTGSGNITISLALEFPEAKIYAIDISVSALEVASMNCRHHKLDSQVELLQGNLLEPLLQPVNIIVANLPYIKDSELKALSPEIINFEPIVALAGGEDGLDKLRCFLDQVPGKIYPEGCLFLEVGQGQDKVVSSIINAYFPRASIELIPDLSGINRVVKAIL